MTDTLVPASLDAGHGSLDSRRHDPDRTDARPVHRDSSEKVNKVSSIPFVLVHLLPLLAVFTGVSTRAVVLCIVLFWTRMFFITAGYHRYFAHRSYRMARVPQLFMAFGATTSAQKGPLWWAAHHRDHHRYSDTQEDIHSPKSGAVLLLNDERHG